MVIRNGGRSSGGEPPGEGGKVAVGTAHPDFGGLVGQGGGRAVQGDAAQHSAFFRLTEKYERVYMKEIWQKKTRIS
jgi:hypothetical protein